MVTWKCVVVLAGSVVCASAGLAEPAEIRGAVTDAAGGALPAVSVALENVATGSETAVATDAGGRFSFSSVPLGISPAPAPVRGFSRGGGALFRLPRGVGGGELLALRGRAPRRRDGDSHPERPRYARRPHARRDDRLAGH